MAEAVPVVPPASRVRQSLFVPIILVIYAAGRIIEILPSTSPSTPIVGIEIVSALAFALVHGARSLGLRSILVFAAICLTIGGAIETIGVRTGFPYGRYEFLPLMGPQVLQVPILLGLAYVGMAYASWVIARTIIGAPNRKLSLLQCLGLPLLAGVVMTSWDFAQDPVWSTLLHAWQWKDGGTWFGVPFTNYCGWLITTSLIYSSFLLYLHRKSAEQAIPTDAWRGAVALYGLCALGNVLQLLKPQALMFVADAGGAPWRSSSILGASALASFLFMGGFSLIAVARAPKTSRES